MAENKEKKVLNVPNLRFPEFEGEWQENYVNEICNEFKSGKAIKADLILDVGTYPVFGGNGLRGYTSTYNHDGLFVLIGRQGALCGNVRSVIGKTYITETCNRSLTEIIRAIQTFYIIYFYKWIWVDFLINLLNLDWQLINY